MQGFSPSAARDTSLLALGRGQRVVLPSFCQGVHYQVPEHFTKKGVNTAAAENVGSTAPVRRPLTAVLFPAEAHGYFGAHADSAQQVANDKSNNSTSSSTSTSSRHRVSKVDLIARIQSAQHWTQVAELLETGLKLPLRGTAGGHRSWTAQQQPAPKHAKVSQPSTQVQLSVLEAAVIRFSELGFSSLHGLLDTDMTAWHACGHRVSEVLGTACKQLQLQLQSQQEVNERGATNTSSEHEIGSHSGALLEQDNSVSALQSCMQHGELVKAVLVLEAMARLDRAFYCRQYFRLALRAACQRAQPAPVRSNADGSDAGSLSQSIGSSTDDLPPSVISQLLWSCWRCQQHITPARLSALMQSALSTQLKAMSAHDLTRCITAVAGLEAANQAQQPRAWQHAVSTQAAIRHGHASLHPADRGPHAVHASGLRTTAASAKPLTTKPGRQNAASSIRSICVRLLPAALAHLRHGLKFEGVQAGDAADLLLQLHASKMVKLQPAFIDACLQAVTKQPKVQNPQNGHLQQVADMDSLPAHPDKAAQESPPVQAHPQASQQAPTLDQFGLDASQHMQLHVHSAGADARGHVAVVAALHRLKYRPSPAGIRVLIQQLQSCMPEAAQVEDLLSLVEPALPQNKAAKRDVGETLVQHSPVKSGSLCLKQLVQVSSHMIALRITPGYMFCAQALANCLTKAPFSAHVCTHVCMLVGLLPALLGVRKEVRLAWVREQLSSLEQLTDRLVPCLRAAPPAALAQLIVGFAALRYHPGKQFLQWHAARCEQLGSRLNPMQLVQVRAAYSSLEYRPNTRLAQLLHQSVRGLQRARVLQEQRAVAAVNVAVKVLRVQRHKGQGRTSPVSRLRWSAKPQLRTRQGQQQRPMHHVTPGTRSREAKYRRYENASTSKTSPSSSRSSRSNRAQSGHMSEPHQEWLLSALHDLN